METILINLIKLAGIGQILLATGSLLIPSILNWKGKLAQVEPLIRQIFWTYAGYIFMINLSFGIISVLAPQELISHSRLAIFFTILVAVYWIVRVLIQFFYFDRSGAPKGFLFSVGECLLVGSFIFFSIIYSLGAFYNLG